MAPPIDVVGDAVPKVAGVLTLDDRFRRALPELVADWAPEPVTDPSLVLLDDALAVELGLDPDALHSPDGVAVLAGAAVPEGAHPVAMAYAGHQFGGYSPRLGDGRALLLGELTTPDGQRLDVHLKGSGRTPFARGGDGRAALGPMLREHLISEAMHALGIPTTRALAVATTGEPVMREGHLPGAVLTRVASSHLRVGTFEYALRNGGPELVARLVTFALETHFPDDLDAEHRPLALLERVIEVQADLVARWMLVGFIHGVMNTDNTTISGETIDYGPCAFMDSYDPATVFSSIDRAGRYAYTNQPAIARWNLSRFAETLLPLVADDEQESIDTATAVLEGFVPRFTASWEAGMRTKLGLVDAHDADEALLDGLVEALTADRADLTGTFRSLAARLRPDAVVPLPEAVAAWVPGWRERLDAEGRDPRAVAEAMDSVNPVVIPRNHLVEEALEAATAGDLAPYEALHVAVTSPFEVPGDERFAQPAPDDFTSGYQTFCGT